MKSNHNKIITSLTKLPCFDDIKKISPINSGISSTSYKIITKHSIYFAKYLTAKVNKVTEIEVTRAAATQGFSVDIIYNNNEWLVNHFISAIELATIKITNIEKYAIATKLMAKCHQLSCVNFPVERLNVVRLTKQLLSSLNFSQQQKLYILQICEQLSLNLHSNKTVLCHGDINFTNILVDKATIKKTYLIDFECACLAPPEYDIAMLAAINCTDLSVINPIISAYQLHSSVKINRNMVMRYLLFCYIINGLWYAKQANVQNSSLLVKYARKQFQLFDQYHNYTTNLHNLYLTTINQSRTSISLMR